jgi:phospholipid/cholesterol/gamma-HCH transport system ATP-binding protein
MIALKNISKSFGKNRVLNNISIDIEKGESFVIIGQSGTGKTVTLRHIAGLIDPDEGVVEVAGQRINGVPDRKKEKIRKKMGIVFQSGALINWMTVGDNVALPLVENRIYKKDKITKLVDEKLRLLQILDAKDKMPSDISGGMKKRVSLARVLIRNPEIILYDEPTSGLDPVMSTLITDLIRQMQKEFGITSVIVTHDMNSAYQVADRIAMLYQGKILQCDVPERIRNTDNTIVRQFINGELSGPIEVV